MLLLGRRLASNQLQPLMLLRHVSGINAYSSTFRLVRFSSLCLGTSTFKYVTSSPNIFISSDYAKLLFLVIVAQKSTDGERTRTVHIAIVLLRLSEMPLWASCRRLGLEPAPSAITDCSAIIKLLRHVAALSMLSTQDNRRAYSCLCLSITPYSDTPRIDFNESVPSSAS